MGKLQLEISRPFRLGGFATGDYMCKCMTCGGEFTGGKRAMTCLPCVVDRINAARSEAQPSGYDGPELPYICDRCVEEGRTAKPTPGCKKCSPGYDGGKSLGERLYEAFWERAGHEVVPFSEAAQAIQMMWKNIERDALTFTASLSDASPKPSSDEQET